MALNPNSFFPFFNNYMQNAAKNGVTKIITPIPMDLQHPILKPDQNKPKPIKLTSLFPFWDITITGKRQGLAITKTTAVPTTLL